MNSPYATIVDNPDFHPAMYAEKVDRALRASDKDAVAHIITSISNNQRQLGLGTDEATLIEILCSRTPDQLAAIRIAYEREYKTPLEKDVGFENFLQKCSTFGIHQAGTTTL
ncbi:unnamed protein product [Cylicostephanus goldi]|uniref:Annexin n=1 Tax=Cylicostephanus goldi TaxID=71465 RepID=A0A3P7NMX0_CYLGO|nr:unnamed protein product [Cylicostephanus goldi]